MERDYLSVRVQRDRKEFMRCWTIHSSKTSIGLKPIDLWCVRTIGHVHSYHTQTPHLFLIHLDKTSHSTTSNPEVNVILLNSKLNWGFGRLTSFPLMGLEHPALLYSKSYVSDSAVFVCVCTGGGGVDKTGEDKDWMFLKMKYVIT